MLSSTKEWWSSCGCRDSTETSRIVGVSLESQGTSNSHTLDKHRYARSEFKHKRYASARHHFLTALTNVCDVIDLFKEKDFTENKKALSELLIPYLVQKRRKIVVEEDKVLSTKVDTILFRAYLCVNGANSPVLLAFLRSSNMCNVKDCEKALRAFSDTSKRWEALVELYV